MTKEIALHCIKSASELERELCEECPIYGQTGSDHCFEDALQYVIGMLEQEPRWIPVSERLPEANTAVLTYVDTGASKTYCLAYWNDVRDGWEEWIGFDLIEKEREYKVLAWMPLPQPYKAESEEV